MLIRASFRTLLLEKTAAGLRERERPHEGVLSKPSAPAPAPIGRLDDDMLETRAKARPRAMLGIVVSEFRVWWSEMW
jgi:hypothetical protein